MEIRHIHIFNVALTSLNGDNDGRYACSQCGLVEPYFTQAENHKGQLCYYRTGLQCQEGDGCPNCQIYSEYCRHGITGTVHSGSGKDRVCQI
jgi:hypothetical protein